MFSSHILFDIERVATDLAFIRDGYISIASPLNDLKESIYRLRISSKTEDVRTLAKALQNRLHQHIDGKDALVTIKNPETAAIEVLRQRADSLEVEPLNLEEIYRELNR